MADTSHHGTAGRAAPVEGDGISYSGLIWFMVVIIITTIVCQVLMWVLLRAFQYQAAASPVPVPPLAPQVTERPGVDGRVYPEMYSIGLANGPQPRLLVNEPSSLADFRKREQEALSTYGWIDQNAGVVRIPIDRAKDLIVERGLPVRGATPAAGKDPKAASKEVKK